MSTLKQIRQRVRDWLDARAENAEVELTRMLQAPLSEFGPSDLTRVRDEIRAQRDHARTVVEELTAHIEAGETGETQTPPSEPTDPTIETVE